MQDVTGRGTYHRAVVSVAQKGLVLQAECTDSTCQQHYGGSRRSAADLDQPVYDGEVSLLFLVRSTQARIANCVCGVEQGLWYSTRNLSTTTVAGSPTLSRSDCSMIICYPHSARNL